jgi:hypothetical protein
MAASYSSPLPRVEPPTEIVVVQNWLQELTRLVPAH